MALECVGEEKCQLSQDSSIEDSSADDYGVVEPSEDSDLSEQERCPNTKTGIYCKKYGYFHCAGKENCETREDYFNHLKEHKEEVQNMDIEKHLRGEE